MENGEIYGENESEKFVDMVLAQLAFGNYDDVVQTINDEPGLIENEEIKEALVQATNENNGLIQYLSDDVKIKLGIQRESELSTKKNTYEAEINTGKNLQDELDKLEIENQID